MRKLEIINKIRDKVVGNIKNKMWFKNYQYKNKGTIEEKILFSLVCSLKYCLFFGIFAALDWFQKIEQLGVLSASFIVGFTVFGSGALTSFSFFKLTNKKNKKEIDDFIKNSENGSNKSMVDLMTENEISSNLNQLVRFVKSQPLEKKDLDIFNKMLVESFSKEELSHVFYNEKLNDMIKEKGCIDYDYIMYALNLLEEKFNDKNYEKNINAIKNDLFKGVSFNNNISSQNNAEKIVSI